MSSQMSYGTIKPQPKFNAIETAGKLRKAMKGLGCSKSKVAAAYAKEYGSELLNDLKSELHGELEDVIVALMIPPPVSDARELRKAISVSFFELLFTTTFFVERNKIRGGVGEGKSGGKTTASCPKF
ncbi:unnamed protein product [Toxocara canis]|uniref:H15 domain-containing protein n=1 Tax=Toxocara canis TaxID=6265 RepID=A0A183U5S5_TOXCA|nr:unnamed protein product [Toxocara canis]